MDGMGIRGVFIFHLEGSLSIFVAFSLFSAPRGKEMEGNGEGELMSHDEGAVFYLTLPWCGAFFDIFLIIFFYSIAARSFMMT